MCKYVKLPLGDIKPHGFLKDRLELQGEGLTGKVPELFKELSDLSAWLGGKGECWERGPYYLDGLFPLAVLTENETLMKRAQHWFDSILSSQREDGFFGPCNNLDRWPRAVFTKQLPSYYEYTHDERVIPFLLRYYTHMSNTLEKNPPYSWAATRGCEDLIAISWLYDMTGDQALVALAKRLISLCFDWSSEFESFRYTRPSEHYMSRTRFNIKKVTFFAPDAIYNFFGGKERSTKKIRKRNSDSFNRFYHLTHGVNLAMALKYPALCSPYTDCDADISKKAYELLMKNHGTAAGLFTCDEHLSSASPTGGTELCAVVEAMYSAEKLLLFTGDMFWADLLELLAFNTLPATFTPDMCAHQYVQQVNQISATRAKRDWYDAYNSANIFGLKPNYACCLSNMHQGFPRFAEHLAVAQESSILLVSPLSMDIDTSLENGRARLKVCSDYPFSPKAEIEVLQGDFTLIIRKPTRCKQLTINGEKYNTELVSIHVCGGDRLSIRYEISITSHLNPDSSVSYYYGNLLLALPIEAREVLDKPKDRFSDRQFFPLSEYRFAPVCDEAVKAEVNKSQEYGIEAVVKARYIENWEPFHNSAGKIPQNPKASYSRFVRLVPYGATVLRIAQFPFI